jgi:aminopeptidase N
MALGGDIDPEAIHQARRAFREALGKSLKEPLQAIYDAYATPGEYSPDPKSVGRRTLRIAALSLLTMGGGRYAIPRLRDHYKQATNMTDTMIALRLFTEQDTPARQQVLDSFYRRWKNDALVLDKWFAVQASSPLPGTLDRVKELLKHPQFSMTNPNRVRSLIAAFAMGNPVHFHAPDGSGYQLLTDAVLELNGFNPLMGARLLSAFETWRMLEPKRQKAARKALEKVRGAENLSRDVFEIASKMLGEPENTA